MDFCIYCNFKHTYTLSNGYIKCAKCKKKYSLQKIKTQKRVIEAFCDGLTARACSLELDLNYITVQKKYYNFREKIIQYLYELNAKRQDLSSEYDEYSYLKSNNIYDIQSFLTFLYEDKVYNLMLPSLAKFKHYNNSQEELHKFLFLNKIAKLQKKESKISEFWNFLEEFLKKYKGINSENFIYYLKEAEFKFNYSKEEQESILNSLV